MSSAPQGVAILGASGNALDILDILDALGPEWEAVGVFDDATPPGNDFAGLPVLGKLHEAACLVARGQSFSNTLFVNAIASERTHRRKLSIIASSGLLRGHFTRLLHPRADISRRAVIGVGVCVGPGCAIAGRVTIGSHVWLGAHVVVGHDTTIGEGATIAPSVTLAGGVEVGPLAYVGSGAVLRPGITVGEGAMIGMGAVVLRDVPAGAVVVGNPARDMLSAPRRPA